MGRQTQIKNKLDKQAWLTMMCTVNAIVPDGEDSWFDRIKLNSKELAELIYEEDDEPQLPVSYVPEYDSKLVQRILELPQYREYAIHYMNLPGFIYRNIEQNRKETIDKVYEIARLTREAGGEALRTFMMNGCRAKSERYTFDALPWQMVNVPGKPKQIDFTKRNELYWEACQVIEDACKYWRIKHRPTMGMDRYNYDIFNERFNVQKINGFRSAKAQAIKIQFMLDYYMFQKSIRGAAYAPTLEIENEPDHCGNHTLGALIADQNLEMFRKLEEVGQLIQNLWVCSSSSEFSHANFVEHHFFEDLHRYFGFSPEFDSRLIKNDYHGVSTLQSLYDAAFDHGLGSAWKHLCFNEDGANAGSYSPIPWTPYRQGSYIEVFDMLQHGLTECRNKGKTFYFTMFMMDCLELDKVDDIAKETYLLHEMNWKRTKAYPDVREYLGR